MAHSHLPVGSSVQFAKTISESDVYLFAGITGDFAANHVNEQRMAETPYGARIAHGALLVGYMSTCSTKLAEQAIARGVEGVPVALGFDRIRFLKPVYFGDTVTLDYEIVEVDDEKHRSLGKVTVVNQCDEVVAVAEHLIKWV